MFPIDLEVFGYTYFVRDVRPQVSKLDPKSFMCIFVGYSRVQKGYRCYCPTLRRYFVSTNVTFFETTSYSLSSPDPSQGENDDLLVYTIASPAPTPALVPVKPPITQVYSQRHNPPVSSPTQATSSPNPVQNDDLLITLRKGNVDVLIQFPHFALMTTCHHILVLLLHPLTIFRCLTRFLKPSLTLVGVVL